MKDLHEHFLNEYFIFSAPIGKVITEEQKKQVFYSLAKAFLIDGGSADKLWSVVGSDAVRQIEDESDYLRYCRAQQYIKEVLQMQVEENDLSAQVIALKGSALIHTMECKIISKKDEGKEKIIGNLINRAGEGCISALNILGIMQIHGVCIEKDETAGLKNLNRTARWCDVDGAMMYLYYCKECRRQCFDIILTSLERRYNSSMIRALKAAYPQEAAAYKKSGVACLIEKAFDAAALSRDEYSVYKADVLYSEILSFEDKETAVFSMGDKQSRSAICDLPLKLDSTQEIQINPHAFDGFVLSRKHEQERILREAQNFDLRKMTNYTPLCLCADCTVLLQYYTEAITKLAPNANVEIIEVGELGKNDIDATSNNIFVRNCDEDKPNIYILSFRGEIEQAAMELARDFLRSGKRRAFRLTQPAAQIDLSCILPVCVCDKANESALNKLCNVVNLASVTQEEKYAILDDMLIRKAKLYGIDEICVDAQVKRTIAKLSADNISKALDKAILANRIKTGKLILDEDKLGKILDEFKIINKYGFGGSIL